MKEFLVRGALLHFSDGFRKRAEIQTKTTDIERVREILKNKHNAKVVSLEYEETN